MSINVLTIATDICRALGLDPRRTMTVSLVIDGTKPPVVEARIMIDSETAGRLVERYKFSETT